MRTLLPVFLLLLVAACRAEDRAPAPPPVEAEAPSAIDTAPVPPVAQTAGACDLLLPEDIARISDAPIERVPGESLSQCTWRRTDGSEGTITVTIRPGAEVADAPLTEAAPVPGVVGDASWNREARLLTIRKDERVALIRFEGFGVREEGANTLARVIAERM